MLLTFILPHYNLQRELLQRCIASIVAQGITAEDYEILVVDDGSDVPPEWLGESFGQQNVRLIMASHGGPGAARNRGLAEARGEYIQFVDADDSLVPGAFGACVEMLRNEKPDILQHGYRECCTEEQMMQGVQQRTGWRRYASGAEYVSRNNLSGCPWMYIFRKDIVDSHNIKFAERVMHEDEDFNTKIYYYGKSLIVCNNVVYNYFKRENSITANRDVFHEIRRINDLFKLLERMVAFRFAEQEVCTLEQRAALNRKIAMLTVDTLLNLYYDGWNAAEVEDVCRTDFRSMGIYPLPLRNYSFKYRLFAILSNSFLGIKLLRKILPCQKPQKR